METHLMRTIAFRTLLMIVAIAFSAGLYADSIVSDDKTSINDSVDAESIVDTIVSSPSETMEKTQKFIKATKDKAYSVADKQGIWIPEGFFDGPHQNDMFVAMLRLLFGLPIDYVLDLLKGTANTEHISTHITLPTFFAKIMNSVGTIIIFVVIAFSTIAFFAKRSMDISYLTVQKEETFPFIFARGTFGTIVSFPIPALGGMSALQGLTIFALLLGLGMASVTIKYAIPFVLSPNSIMQPQPHVAQFVDYVLEAKTCTMAEAMVDGKDISSYTNADTGYDIETKNIVRSGHYALQETITSAHFGVDEKGNCGSVLINKVTSKFKVKESEKVDAATTKLLSEIISSTTVESIKTIWTNPLINKIAMNLNGDIESVQFSSMAQDYANYRLEQQEAIIGTITNKMREKFNANIDGKNSIFEKYKENIGNVGFMGLGALHTMLTYQQTQITQSLNDIFAERSNPPWETSTIDAKTGILQSIMNIFDDFNEDEHIIETRQALRLFFNEAYKAKPNSNPKTRIDAVTNQFTNHDEAQWLGQEIIEIFREDSNGVVFPNPIVEMRSVGNTIINVAVITFLGAQVADVATSTGLGAVVKKGVMKKFGAAAKGGEKLSTLAGLTLISMLGIGWFYSSVVPNIPYIMWSLAVFSYLSYCAAAIIAAGWWGGAMAISNPTNERSFAGRIHEGANIILTLVLKPFLMTLSFFIAMLLNTALGYYLQWSLESSAVSASYGSASVGSLLSMLFINGVLMAAGLLKNHSLIWELPDHLQRMLGFRAGYEDKSHDQAHSQATQMSSSLGGSIKEVVGKSTAPSFKGGIS